MAESTELSFIPTRSSRLKQDAEKQFESVVYESYKKKIKPEKETDPKQKPSSKDKEEEVNMKKIRYEVIKFGMSGFEGKKKHDVKVQLAISLGAKPKKNHSINYKRLQERRKKETLEAEKEKSMQQLGKTKLGMSNAKGKKFDKNRKKKNKGLLDPYGVATYKMKEAIEKK